MRSAKCLSGNLYVLFLEFALMCFVTCTWRSKLTSAKVAIVTRIVMGGTVLCDRILSPVCFLKVGSVGMWFVRLA